jgi:hypothetical protein
MMEVTRAKLKHKQVRSILTSDTYVHMRGQSTSKLRKEDKNSPEIRATLRLCHSSGEGRERRAKGEVTARSDMGKLARGVLVRERKKVDEVGNARWEVIIAVKRGREFKEVRLGQASNEGAVE